MKKYLLTAVLILSMAFIVSCGKPEAGFLKKYFNAVQMKDNDTMASMAVEPVSFIFSKWSITSIGELQSGEAEYTAAKKAFQEVSDKLDALKTDVLDANDALEEAKANLSKARGYRAKKTAQAKVDELQQKKDELFNQFKDLQKQKQEAKDNLDHVIMIIKKSLGEHIELEGANIKKESKNVEISVVTPSGTKDYKVIFVRYIMDINGRTQNGRWIILKFVPLTK
jgi:chaperonin cofactor prefoldin